MWMCVTVSNTSVCSPTGVCDTDGMPKDGARCITDQLDWVNVVIGAGFFDNGLTQTQKEQYRVWCFCLERTVNIEESDSNMCSLST